MSIDAYEPINEMSEQDMMNELATIITTAKVNATDEALVATLDRASALTDAICNAVYDFLDSNPIQ